MKYKTAAAFVFLLFFIFCSLRLTGAGDWKKEVGNFFKKAHDFHNITSYLEKNLVNIPDPEKPLAVIILCYAYKELENPVNEEKWLTRYFEKYRVDSPDFPFLSRSEKVRIFEYIDRWHRKYPNLKKIRIAESSRRVPYFDPPAVFTLVLQMGAPSEIVITNIQKETIYTGYLDQGINTINIPFGPVLQKLKENHLHIHLKTGSLEILKTVTLVSQCDYPGYIDFNRVEGRVSVKGESFREEQTTEIIVETKRYFDKRHFFKKAVLSLAVGGAIYILNRLVIHKELNSKNGAADTRALMNSLNRTFNVVAIGFSLKGIRDIFKSFKRKQVKKEKTVVHKEDAAHNNLLRRLIREAKKEIFINYQLKDKEVNREK